MKSRAISALVFGLCFSVIFTAISFFTPPITRTNCGANTTIEIFGMPLSGESCDGGGSTETIGLPFATREQKFGPTVNPNSPGFVPDDPGLKFSPAGAIGNLIAYWIFGFVFFFIFSRTRKVGKKKNI